MKADSLDHKKAVMMDVEMAVPVPVMTPFLHILCHRTARQFILDVFNNVDNKGRTTKPSITSFDTAFGQSKSSNRKSSSMHPGLIDMLLPPPSGYGFEEIGAYVVSPCTHDQQCPLAPGGWCSFSQKVNSIVDGMSNASMSMYFYHLL